MQPSPSRNTTADPSGSSPGGSAASVPVPPRRPAAPPRPDRVVPSWVDPVVAQASEAVGGPWGRHAVTGRALFWTPLRICLLFTTLVLSLAWIKQAPCADGNWVGHVQYTHFCYSDAVPLFGIHGLDKGQIPYLDSPVEYPVLIGGFMQLSATIAQGYDHVAASVGVLPHVPPVESFYVVNCLLLAALALLVTRAVLPLAGHRPWDAALVGLSPLLLVHAFTNWDLIAVALSTLGMWAWARNRPVVAGALLGLGVAAKLYPLLLLGGLLVLCLRAGRWRPWLAAVAAAVVAWLAVDLPIALLAPANWGRFFALSSQRPANPETLWNMALYWSGNRILDGPLRPGQTPTVLNAAVAVALVLAVGAIVLLVLAAPVRPRVAQVAFLLVAAFLLLNKVWSPQYSLWLLPLAALARPRWRSLLFWQATEAVVWVVTLLNLLGDQNKGIDTRWFFLGVGVRDVVVVVLMGLVIREMWFPDRDVVRTSWPGTDDPAGGPLDGAPDRWTMRRIARSSSA